MIAGLLAGLLCTLSLGERWALNAVAWDLATAFISDLAAVLIALILWRWSVDLALDAWQFATIGAAAVVIRHLLLGRRS